MALNCEQSPTQDSLYRTGILGVGGVFAADRYAIASTSGNRGLGEDKIPPSLPEK
ncbi:MAG TPA: hypothetical protein V6C91_01705 [Coleofasciculaceae cyanobacterium]